MKYFFIDKNLAFRNFPLITIALVLAACGGAGGGGSGSGLATGEFSKSIGTAAPALYSGLITTNSYSRVQYLYQASNIRASGNITSLKLTYLSDQSTPVTCPNVNIRLGHTTLTALTATFASNIEQGAGTFETVLDDRSITFSTGSAGDQFTIALPTSFNYNGVDNLVVEIERTSGCDGLVTDVTDNLVTSDSAVWTFTQGSLTGFTGSLHDNMEFVFSGGDNSLDYPGSLTSNVPFSTISSRHQFQTLHLSSDINGSGPITGIAFVSGENPTDAANYTVSIALGHTTRSDLTDTFANNFDPGGPEIVTTALTYIVPAGLPVGTPVWLPITEPFNYNGTDNLVVEIEISSASATTSMNYASLRANFSLYAAVGDLQGTLNVGPYETVFRFNGSTMGLITGGPFGSGNTWPFNNSQSPKHQFLYRASELGTGGTITGIACRMQSITSTATNHSNFEVVLGHTDRTALTAIFADNMQDATTVFSGLFTVPGGLNRGDWIEIPLTTPFAYDGVRNLVVQHASDASGTFTHTCRSHSDPTRFPSRRVTSSDRLALVGSTVLNQQFNLKLEFSK